MTVVTSNVCPGYLDGLIRQSRACNKFKKMPPRLYVTQALAYLSYIEFPLSRPTLIKVIIKLNIGRQPFGPDSRWTIDARKFIEAAKQMEGEE